MSKKLTYEHVKNYIESKGYTLIDKEYKNNRTKLKIKCPEGHEYKVSFHTFKQGHRCPICERKKSAKKRAYSYEYVKNTIEKEGYTLLDKEYKNAHVKLKVRCPEGHEYEVTFDSFKRGQRCAICQGVKKYTHEEVKKYIESKGYTLLDGTYKNANTKLRIKCSKGHEYKVKFSHFQQGHRCPTCARVKKLTYEHVKNYIESKGYTLLDKEYKNNSTKLRVRCPKGHEYKVQFNNFKNGKRCPICNAEATSSKAEIEIQEMVKSIVPDIICNDRTQILNPLTGHNLELDVWMPSLKKAIEFNGTYWHSKSYQKVKDKIKKDQCKEKGIDLLIIEEQKWMDCKEIEIKRIKQWLLK